MLKIATLQMDAAPAPTPARLARAEVLITAAAAAGAQLVVLPELFNLGYAYHDDNFRRAEPPNGPTATWLQATAGRQTFGTMVRQQAAWLGVPVVSSTGCGQVSTAIPNGVATLLAMLPLAPRLLRYLPQARHLHVTYDFVPCGQVVGADGAVLAALTPAQGETFTVAEVTLPATRPQPRGPQPPSPVPRPAYWISDGLLPALVSPVYRRGARRAGSPPTP